MRYEDKTRHKQDFCYSVFDAPQMFWADSNGAGGGISLDYDKLKEGGSGLQKDHSSRREHPFSGLCARAAVNMFKADVSMMAFRTQLNHFTAYLFFPWFGMRTPEKHGEWNILDPNFLKSFVPELLSQVLQIKMPIQWMLHGCHVTKMLHFYFWMYFMLHAT